MSGFELVLANLFQKAIEVLLKKPSQKAFELLVRRLRQRKLRRKLLRARTPDGENILGTVESQDIENGVWLMLPNKDQKLISRSDIRDIFEPHKELFIRFILDQVAPKRFLEKFKNDQVTLEAKVIGPGPIAGPARKKNLEDGADFINELFEECALPLRIKMEVNSFVQWPFGMHAWETYEKGIFQDELDIVSFEGDEIQKFHEYLLPLGGYIQTLGMDFFSDIHDTLWDSLKHEGRIYAIPQDLIVNGILFRRDVLKEITAGPDEFPEEAIQLDGLLDLINECSNSRVGIIWTPPVGSLSPAFEVKKGQLKVKDDVLEGYKGFFARLSEKNLVNSPISFKAEQRRFIDGEALSMANHTGVVSEWVKIPYSRNNRPWTADNIKENIEFVIPRFKKSHRAFTSLKVHAYAIPCDSEEKALLSFLVIAGAITKENVARYSAAVYRLPIRSSVIEEFKTGKYLNLDASGLRSWWISKIANQIDFKKESYITPHPNYQDAQRNFAQDFGELMKGRISLAELESSINKTRTKHNM